MRGSADILKDREARGLSLFICAQLLGLIFLGLAIIVFVERSEPLLVFSAGIPVLGMLAGLLAMVQARYRMSLAGHVAILVSLFATGPIIFLEWNGAGIETYSAAYVAKTGYPLGLVLVAMTGLTLQPHYPATVTGMLVIFHLGLLGFALDDPRIEFADPIRAWGDHVMGPALHLGRFANHLAITVVTGATVTLATWIARKTVLSAISLERVNGHLRRYFSPDVAETVAGETDDIMRQGGRLREIVVLSSDINGFTSFSQDLEPDETVAMLSEYRAPMIDAIFRHGGSVDKFIGDGILATFGAVRDLDGPGRRGMAAARDMMAALEHLNVRRKGRGLSEFGHRIGLHKGPALVGNVGSDDRLEFTVIGDVVNVATRIERICKETGDDVLVSAPVLDEAPNAAVASRGSPPLRGVQTPPELFALDWRTRPGAGGAEGP